MHPNGQCIVLLCICFAAERTKPCSPLPSSHSPAPMRSAAFPLSAVHFALSKEKVFISPNLLFVLQPLIWGARSLCTESKDKSMGYVPNTCPDHTLQWEITIALQYQRANRWIANHWWMIKKKKPNSKQRIPVASLVLPLWFPCAANSSEQFVAQPCVHEGCTKQLLPVLMQCPDSLKLMHRACASTLGNVEVMAELLQRQHSSAVQHWTQIQREVIAYRHTERKGESKAQKPLRSSAGTQCFQTDCNYSSWNSLSGWRVWV